MTHICDGVETWHHGRPFDLLSCGNFLLSFVRREQFVLFVRLFVEDQQFVSQVFFKVKKAAMIFFPAFVLSLYLQQQQKISYFEFSQPTSLYS